MMYILVLWMVTGSGLAATTAEFGTKQACDTALATVLQQRGYETIRGVCVPKSTAGVPWERR